MKKRRVIIALFLLVAVAIMGIGYAELVDQLTISGSAGVTAFDADVYFASEVTEVKEDPADDTKFSTLSAVDDAATMTVKEGALRIKGDKASATFTVMNDSDISVVVTPTIKNDSETFFKVTTDWDGVAKTIAPQSSVTITVTVLVDLMPTANDVKTTFSVTLDAVGQND